MKQRRIAVESNRVEQLRSRCAKEIEILKDNQQPEVAEYAQTQKSCPEAR